MPLLWIAAHATLEVAKLCTISIDSIVHMFLQSILESGEQLCLLNEDYIESKHIHKCLTSKFALKIVTLYFSNTYL